MTSPGQRTLERLRKEGYMVDIVEKLNAHARIRQDLYGFIDVLACHPEHGFLAVQCTSGANTASRVTKIREERRENAINFLKAGGRIEVWGWRKLKVKRGGKAVRWEPAIKTVTLEDLLEEAA